MGSESVITWELMLNAFAMLLVPALWPYISVFLHEFGHIIAAKLLGLNPTHLIVGDSDPLLRKRLFGVELIVCLVPFVGFAVIQPRRLSRIKEVAFIAAGPVVDMGIVGLAVSLWFQTPLKLALFLIMVFELIKICVNIYPRSFAYEGLTLRTDGKRILDLFSASKPTA